jgi:thioesterase domain-containing protein
VHLAKYFVNERPVYALRARGFGEGEAPFERFDEMVETYTAAVRRAQPSGPYALTGYSYGGVVAFEVAKALERAGERVAFVGALNVQPDISASRKAIDFVYTAVNLAFLLSLVGEREAAVLTDELRAVPAEDVVRRLLALASPKRLAELDLDLPRFARWVEIAFSLVKIARDYEPTGSVSAMTVLYASPPLIYPDLAKSAWLADKLRRWDVFSRAPVDYIDVPGKHQTVMAEHVAEFQAVLRHRLACALNELNEINKLNEGETK